MNFADGLRKHMRRMSICSLVVLGAVAAVNGSAQSASIKDEVTSSGSAMTVGNPFTVTVSGSSIFSWMPLSIGSYTYTPYPSGTSVTPGATSIPQYAWTGDNDSLGGTPYQICGTTPSDTTSSNIGETWGTPFGASISFSWIAPVAGTSPTISITDDDIQSDPSGNLAYSCGLFRWKGNFSATNTLRVGHHFTLRIRNAHSGDAVYINSDSQFSPGSPFPIFEGNVGSDGTFTLQTTTPDFDAGLIDTQQWAIGTSTLTLNYYRRYAVIADGDSLTDGWTYCGSATAPCGSMPTSSTSNSNAQSNFIPAVLPYPSSISAINLGVAGNTSANVLNSTGCQRTSPCHLAAASSYATGSTTYPSANARWYILWVGTNDLLTGVSLGNTSTAGTFEYNVSQIVSAAHTDG